MALPNGAAVMEKTIRWAVEAKRKEEAEGETTGQTRRGKGPEHEWVQLAPNMGAGASYPQATLDLEDEEEEQQGCEGSEQQEKQQEREQAEEVESERVTVKRTEEVEI